MVKLEIVNVEKLKEGVKPGTILEVTEVTMTTPGRWTVKAEVVFHKSIREG